MNGFRWLLDVFSSHLMTPLLAWRNPDGDEERWMQQHPEVENEELHAGKVILTEIGLCLITVAAV